MNKHTRIQYSVLAVALATAYPMHTAIAAAGTAQFIAGEVNVRRGDGTSNPLVRGRDLASGESIVTGSNGRAQVRWSDGGLLSLQPNTEFRIANYVDKADPKEDRFLVDLLRGSMRAVTGLIGKRNRDNYKVTTTTATIGIRGSSFSAGYNIDGSLSVTTELDAIEVCTAGGCVPLRAGETALVVNNTDRPQRVGTRPSSSTPPPAQAANVAGNQANPNGNSSLVPDRPVVQLPAQPPTEPVRARLFTDLSVGTVYTYAYNDGEGGGVTVASPEVNSPNNVPDGVSLRQDVVSKIADGKLTEFQRLRLLNATYGGGTETNSFTDTSPTTSTGGSLGDPTNADYVGWGTWATGFNNYASGTTYVVPTDITAFSYILGRPAAPPMTHSGLTGNYSLAGGTAWSSIYSRGELLNTSRMTVNFGEGMGNGTINLDAQFTGQPIVNIFSNIYTEGSRIYSDSYSGNGESFNGYSNSSDTSIEGFFVGANASRAAVVYRSDTQTAGIVSGAAAFQQSGSLTPSPPPAPEPFTNLSVGYNHFDPLATGTFSQAVLASNTSPVNTYFVDGKLSRFDIFYGNGQGPTDRFSDASTSTSFGGSNGNPGDSATNFVGWGTWTAATKQRNTNAPIDITALSYVVGVPTANMPTGQLTGYYSLLGGTAWSSMYQRGELLNTSDMTINFGTSLGSINLNTRFTKPDGNFADVNIADVVDFTDSKISDYNGGARFNGFFVGANAARAAVVYLKEGTIAGTVSGSAAFEQYSLVDNTPPPPINLRVAASYASGPSNFSVAPFDTTSGILTGSTPQQLVEFTTPAAGPVFKANTGQVTDAGSLGYSSGSDFIGWGRWVSGMKDTSPLSNLHYLVGKPTLSMPGGGVATYSLAGSTVATSYNGGTATLLNSSSLTADFTAGKVGASIVTNFRSTEALTYSNMAISGATFSGNGGNGGTAQGFFTGVDASRAGLTYTGTYSSGGPTFTGAAVFNKNLAPPPL